MTVLLQIQDTQADFVMELLSKFPFVKAQSLTPEKLNHIQDFRKSVQEVEAHLSGKKRLKPVKDLLSEL